MTNRQRTNIDKAQKRLGAKLGKELKKRLDTGRPEIDDEECRSTYVELLGMAGNQRRPARSSTASKSAINW